jgi:hypothetical protein
MATDFELAVFERQMREVLELPEAARWILERDDAVPLGIFATMHPRSNPEELFKARLRWDHLFKAPSLSFIDPTSGSDRIKGAWPTCFGFRPDSLDTCLPWTAEGHRHHPEWQHSATTRFPNVDAPLQFALLNIQSSLDNSYAGRGGC